MGETPKTRWLRDQSDWTCPMHRLKVTYHIRYRADKESGRYRPSGDYYGCPRYDECGYYVSPGKGERFRVRILDGSPTKGDGDGE